MISKHHNLWQPYQRDYWTECWKNSIYSIHDRVDGDRWISVKHDLLLQYVLKHSAKNTKILEAGCGMGQWVVYLANLGYKIVGIDFVQSMLKEVKKRYPKLQFIAGDITSFPFADSAFDAVLSWSVVEHFESGPSDALKETFRILSRSGTLYITVPCKNYCQLFLLPLLYVKTKIAENRIIRKIRKKPPIEKRFSDHSFTKKSFRDCVIQAGFDIKKIMPISHEIGFANAINSILRFGSESKIFHKNKVGKWDRLTPAGETICKLLRKVSPWLTPDQIFIIAVKKQ